jgi:hypothetical protein
MQHDQLWDPGGWRGEEAVTDLLRYVTCARRAALDLRRGERFRLREMQRHLRSQPHAAEATAWRVLPPARRSATRKSSANAMMVIADRTNDAALAEAAVQQIETACTQCQQPEV